MHRIFYNYYFKYTSYISYTLWRYLMKCRALFWNQFHFLESWCKTDLQYKPRTPEAYVTADKFVCVFANNIYLPHIIHFRRKFTRHILLPATCIPECVCVCVFMYWAGCWSFVPEVGFSSIFHQAGLLSAIGPDRSRPPPLYPLTLSSSPPCCVTRSSGSWSIFPRGVLISPLDAALVDRRPRSSDSWDIFIYSINCAIFLPQCQKWWRLKLWNITWSSEAKPGCINQRCVVNIQERGSEIENLFISGKTCFILSLHQINNWIWVSGCTWQQEFNNCAWLLLVQMIVVVVVGKWCQPSKPLNTVWMLYILNMNSCSNLRPFF